MNTTLFLALIVGHLLADFPLQTDFIYKLKIRGWYGIIPHALVHIGVLALVLAQPDHYWPLLFTVFSAHFFIDWVKLRLRVPVESFGFLADQLFHVASLLVITMLFPHVQVILPVGVLSVVLGYALIPALLMLASIASRDARALTATGPYEMGWSHRFLELSHVLGWPLVVAVLLIQVVHFL